MKVYIAAPYPLRDEAIAMMHALEAKGYMVTSRWLRERDDDGDEAARKDIEDIIACDMLLAYHPEAWHDRGTGGRHFEMGFAFAIGRSIALLGKRTSNFHHLAQVRVIERLEEL